MRRARARATRGPRRPAARDVIAGQARRNVDLDGHDVTVDARERGAANRGEHGGPPESLVEEGRDRGDLDGTSKVPRAYDDYAWPRLARAASRRLVTCVRGWGRSLRCGVSWAVDEFVASLAGASGHTAEAYERDVRQFVAWAERGGCPSPDQVDHTTLRRYLAFLTTRQFARRSMARKAASLRAYLRYLHRHEIIPTDPGRSLRAPKGEARLPRVPRQAEAVALLDAASAAELDDDDTAGAATAWRDLAVLEVLYGAGKSAACRWASRRRRHCAGTSRTGDPSS